MKKVSWLRLLLSLFGISLAVGENLKQNNGKSMANNESTQKGLFFTKFNQNVNSPCEQSNSSNRDLIKEVNYSF